MGTSRFFKRLKRGVLQHMAFISCGSNNNNNNNNIFVPETQQKYCLGMQMWGGWIKQHDFDVTLEFQPGVDL